jgi:hypothetical protein
MTTRASAGLPELGSLLGGLISPPGEKSPVEASFESVRLDLLTALFDRAGAARELLRTGDEPGARSALGGPLWLEAWEQAVTAAARAVSAEIERRIREAAAETRFPPKRIAARLPDAEERRVLAARLSAAGIGLEAAIELLSEPSRPWTETLRRVAGELEAAWDQLLITARTELERWEPRATAVRGWRRSWRPLTIAAAILLPLATWMGLILGGYLHAPGWLRPFTNWVWNL